MENPTWINDLGIPPISGNLHFLDEFRAISGFQKETLTRNSHIDLEPNGSQWQPREFNFMVFSLRRTESSIVFSIPSTESSDFGGVRQDVVRPCAGTSREIYNA